jgi:RNA polymerase sigma-54 factor
MILYGKLLQVPVASIEQLILRELARNPALDLKDENFGHASRAETASADSTRPDGAHAMLSTSRTAVSGEENHDFITNIPYRPSVCEQLLADARLMVDQDDLDVVAYLLYSLDEKGYLRTSPQALASELAVSLEKIERVLDVLKQLDPPGIGAKNLRECLLIQCKHLEADGVDCRLVQRILSEAWEDFCAKRWSRVARTLGVAQPAIAVAANFITSNLYPYPLNLIVDPQATTEAFHSADIVFFRKIPTGHEYAVTIPHASRYVLQISPGFQRAMQGDANTNITAEEEEWMKSHIEQARLFISAVEQRWETLRKIGEHLVQQQRGFLTHGTVHLKPLTRSTMAEELGLHESTISRAVRDKVALLPNGHLIALSDFFDYSLAPKEALRQLLAKSKKPLNDRQITDHLLAKGFKLSRRTVSKYRKQIGVQASNKRRTSLIGIEQR